MFDLVETLQKPTNLRENGVARQWFDLIAKELLENYNLVVAGELYRLVEIEFYCHAEEHPDIFTHRDKLQLQFGRWYFHRMAGKYKSGSFKGLDLACGEGNMHFGILIRTIAKADGTLICGPSLCVDNLLTVTQCESVAELDKKIEDRQFWQEDNILRLQQINSRDARQNKPIYTSGRVGLSLKKAKATSTNMFAYILRPYRYLNEPKLVSKGKVYLTLSLHQQGIDIEAISQITGSPKRSIEKYIADFEIGRDRADFSDYLGVDLNTEKLCQLHGTWAAKVDSL